MLKEKLQKDLEEVVARIHRLGFKIVKGLVKKTDKPIEIKDRFDVEKGSD